jgi:hypothetical protein
MKPPTKAPASPTDTPVRTPPDTAERVKAFIGDIARPFAIYVTSGAASVATIMVAFRTDNGTDAALLIGAVYAGLGALYAARAWENTKTAHPSQE